MSLSSIDDQVMLHQHPAELLQALLRFDTTNPPGTEAAWVCRSHESYYCIGNLFRHFLLVAYALPITGASRERTPRCCGDCWMLAPWKRK